jgi:D-serine deaminase-like pyridoxal phosphate-dependent protein
MSTPALRAGDPVGAIDTPALVVDLDAMQRNLQRMATFARTHGLRLRPHAKMHKCSAIARLQIEAGAVGVCVQKTAEAEAMAAGGRRRHLHQQRDRRRGQAGARRPLAGRFRLAIAVDSSLGIDRSRSR